MKRLISGILAAAVACGSALCPAIAASAAEDNGYAVSASFDKTEAGRGESLTMTVSLDENPGLVSLRFQVKYDPAAVTIENNSDITSLEDFGVPGSFTSPKANNESGTVILRWSCPLSEENVTKTGDIAAVKFTVKSDAPIGSTGICIVPIEVNMIDENLDFVNLEEKYGTGVEGYFKTPSERDIDKMVKISCAHTWNAGTVTEEPSCTENGVKTFTCIDCGETKTEDIAALGHDRDGGTVTAEPTCTEKGVKTFTCTRCNDTKTEEVEALGHTWDEGTVTEEPTCTEKGVKTFTCTKCDETKTEEVPALGHDWGEWTVTKEATSEEEGEEARECEICGEKETRTVAKLPPVITTTIYTGGGFSVPETTTAAATTIAESEVVTTDLTTAAVSDRIDDTTAAAAVTADSAPADNTTAGTDGNISGNTEGTAAADNGNSGNDVGNAGDSSDNTNKTTGVALAVIPSAMAAAGVLIFKKRK
ncbi:MAG: hypothetical protein HDT47_05045 [Ruminococcaceae bacterium]|nr:hypothetical protein [Oscillospiraceae bacterium]